MLPSPRTQASQDLLKTSFSLQMTNLSLQKLLTEASPYTSARLTKAKKLHSQDPGSDAGPPLTQVYRIFPHFPAPRGAGSAELRHAGIRRGESRVSLRFQRPQRVHLSKNTPGTIDSGDGDFFYRSGFAPGRKSAREQPRGAASRAPEPHAAPRPALTRSGGSAARAAEERCGAARRSGARCARSARRAFPAGRREGLGVTLALGQQRVAAEEASLYPMPLRGPERRSREGKLRPQPEGRM